MDKNLPMTIGKNYPVPVDSNSNLPAIYEPKREKRSFGKKLGDFFQKKVETVRKVDWFEMIEHEYVRLKIIPDSSVRNWRSEDIMRTIADQFRLPIDRLVREGFKVTGYRVQERASFEIQFKDNQVNFFISVPENIAPLIQRRLQSVWDKATIEKVNATEKFDFDKTAIFENVYRKHDMYSISTDSKNNIPMTSFLEAGRLLGENERASIFAYFDPIHQMSWHYEMNEAWKKLRDGKVPRKWNASGREIMKLIGASLTSILQELVGGVSEIMSGGKEENAYTKKVSDPDATQYSIDQLSESTKSKPNKPAVKTYIWTLAEAEEESRRELIGRTLSQSFNDLSADNELETKQVASKKKKAEILRTCETKKPPKINVRSNKMSTAEASKIVQVPGHELQEKYKEIERIEQKETEINNKSFFDEDGILIGYAKFKGCENVIYQPKDDIDEICLPHVGIGGMGQGKTAGLLSNYLLEYTVKGFGGLAIDPAKGEIGNELQHAVDCGVLPEDKFVRYNLSQEIFALDFCEALHDDRAKARLANIVVHFFDVADETTGQTERFLRAAVLGMKTGRIAEIMKIFQDDKYLENTINRLKYKNDEFNASTLNEYKKYSPSMRMKILSPIYNRLNDIMGDPFLADCLKSDNSLDMVEIMSQRKAVVFDVLAKDLDKVAIDIIVSLLSLKIDLAMRMREKVKGEEFPFVVEIDEPHQFSKSSKIWQDAVVESRKFRVCYFWTFHYWEQIPAKLQKAIRSALPHYHLYPTTTQTWQSLRDEIYPFTVQDALKVRRWHAINIIRSGGENAVPFLARMEKPPTKRFKS